MPPFLLRAGGRKISTGLQQEAFSLATTVGQEIIGPVWGRSDIGDLFQVKLIFLLTRDGNRNSLPGL